MVFRSSRARDGAPTRGQAMVEFALVLPILALLLVMAIDFGRVFFGWVALHNASRIAADFAASHADAWTANEDRYRSLVLGDLQAINCSPADGSWDVADIPDPDYPSGTLSGMPAIVGLDCEMGLITPLAEAIVGGPVALAAETSFPIHKAIQQPLPPNAQPDPAPSEDPDPDPDPDPDVCAAPVASFSTSPAAGSNGRIEGASPLSVAFTDTSAASADCPITTWSWNFGNGSSSLPDPTQVFVHPTGSGGPVNFVVVLTVINSEGSDTASVTVRVSR